MSKLQFYTYIRLWTERQGLNEEHGIRKSCGVRVLACFPDDSNDLLEFRWDKTALWYDSNWDWRRCVDMEGSWCCFAWVVEGELGTQMASLYPSEFNLVAWIDIDEMRSNINS